MRGQEGPAGGAGIRLGQEGGFDHALHAHAIDQADEGRGDAVGIDGAAILLCGFGQCGGD